MRHLIGVSVLSAAITGGCSAEQATVQQAPQSQALQGQVPLADQLSGRSLQPYMWNMRLVGQQDIQNRGENGNLGWIGDCAYVSAYCTHSSATVRRRDTSGSTACSTAS